MPINSTTTSSLSGFPKIGQASEPATQPRRRGSVRNLITTLRLRLGKLVSFAAARVLVIFSVGFAAGIAWQSYGGAERQEIAGWSPHLAWMAPPSEPAGTSADRYKAVALALTTARQSLDKLGTEISKAQAQGGDAPQRKKK